MNDYRPRHQHLPSPKTKAKVIEYIQACGPVSKAEIVAHTKLHEETITDALRALYLREGGIYIAAWRTPGNHRLFAVGNLPDAPKPLAKHGAHASQRQERPHIPPRPLPPIAWLASQPLPELSKRA